MNSEIIETYNYHADCPACGHSHDVAIPDENIICFCGLSFIAVSSDYGKATNE